MTLFMLVTSVGFQVFMLSIAITCVAMPYILREVQNLARSLIRFGVPVSIPTLLCLQVLSVLTVLVCTTL